MRINFFEEYPTKENLEKARDLVHPATIYLGAHSLAEFFKYKAMLNDIDSRMTAGYWPILPTSYWISPFSRTDELLTLQTELREYMGEKFPVLFDLELPLLRKHRGLLFSQLASFSRNKRIVRELHGLIRYQIYTAQDALQTTLFPALLSLFGLNYPVERFGHTPILMHYTSMMPKSWVPLLRRAMRKVIEQSTQGSLQVALGCLAQGAYEKEPILTPAQLFEDLTFLKEVGVDTVTLFRLGGLNSEYLKILNRFD